MGSKAHGPNDGSPDGGGPSGGGQGGGGAGHAITFHHGPAAGGQPGIIRLRGAVAYGDDSIDETIQPKLVAGLAMNGSRAVTSAGFDVSNVPDAVDLSQEMHDHTMIALGCDPELVSARAKELGLDIVQAPVATAKKELTLRAHVVALCSDLGGLKVSQLTIDADSAVLSGVEHTQLGAGSFTINTNDLVMDGPNHFTAKALDEVGGLPAKITLNVKKQLKRDANGRVELLSVGATY